MPEADSDSSSVERFVKAQEYSGSYQSALAEIRFGLKRGHWIWYIFPQMRGLGFSEMSQYYGIADLAEAKAYWEHPVLGARLREITDALLAHAGRKTTYDILGAIDDMKVKSSMTLFSLVGDDRFQKVLDTFYNGERDQATLELLGIS